MKKKVLLTLIIALIALTNKMFSVTRDVTTGLVFVGGSEADQLKLREALPAGIVMVDNALQILGKGWENMTNQERAFFQIIFDPGKTDKIDTDFVQASAENLTIVRERLSGGLRVVFVNSSYYCEDMTLFYTDFMNIYACPYLTSETDVARIAHDLVHEVGHIALRALDRAYFSQTDSRYLALIPRPKHSTGMAALDFLLRELDHQDTLFNPDSYTHFASDLDQKDRFVPENTDLSGQTSIDSEVIRDAVEMDLKLLNVIPPEEK